MDFKEKRQKRIHRHKRVRAKIIGTPSRPRLSVFRSNKQLYAQLIDDTKGRTLMVIKTTDLKEKTNSRPIEKASKIGQLLAKKAVEGGIKGLVFDRGGYKYHGQVKALAEGVREGGLKF